jgi:hypothetical protein
MVKTITGAKTYAGRIPVCNSASYFIIPESLNDPCCTSRKPTLSDWSELPILFTGEMNAN